MRGRNKYGAVKTTIEGITFASKLEASRYQELRILERAGHITHLKLQVVYQLDVLGVRICRYIADFVYERDGETIVEDSKGMLTDVFNLKRKLMKAVHGIDVVCVYADKRKNAHRKPVTTSRIICALLAMFRRV